jgi:ATP-dependent Clp protease protease subunit
MASSKKPNKASKTVYLFDEVGTNSTLKCIQQLQNIIESNDDYENPKDPIKLIINSGGGDVYDGLALIGFIESSPIQINTYSYGGRVMSMALPIFLAGKVRTATKYTTFMHHTSSWGMDYAKIEIHKQELAEVERLENMINDLVIRNTKIDKKTLDKYQEINREWYIPAVQAKKLGIIHHLI